MLFEQIFKELTRLRIKYLVIGGMAVNLHGFPRATADLDLMISLDPGNVRNFIRIIRKLKWLPRIPVDLESFADPAQRNQWAERKGMTVFSVYNPKNQVEQIDVLIKNTVDFESAYRAREVLAAGRLKINVAAIRDVIKLKEKAGRDRDGLDIMALKEIQRIRNEKSRSKKKSGQKRD